MQSEKAERKTRAWLTALECPVDKDADYENTFWCNRDLIPIPRDRRTWTWQDFSGYWVIAGINATSYTIASSLLVLGLTVGQAMGVIVGASLCAGLLAVTLGWMGSHHYVGFTVLSRGAWGMRGGFWPVLNRIMTACIWMGIQMYWGGQAVKIVLGAIIGPKFVFMANTLPLSAHVDTASLTSFFIFLIIFAPILLIPPEKLQMPFRIAFVMITSTIFGMLIWALTANHGVGIVVNTQQPARGSTLHWNTVYSLSIVIGTFGTGCLGQSDWTRYARTPNAALFGQLITAPLCIIVSSLCGVLITSATSSLYGILLWNPFELLLYIQQNSLSPSARAGTFFAGLGFLASAISLCVVTNSVACGMDFAALSPKYINIRRGSYLCTIIAVAICPWNFVTQASTFIDVLSGWSVFISPMTGILVADYFLVRKQQLHVGDLYLGNSHSAYWYIGGFNWRAIIAWLVGLGPLLPGFVREVTTLSDGSAWDHLYQLSYFYGFLAAGTVYWVCSAVFPTKKQRGSSPFKMLMENEDEVIYENKLVEKDGPGLLSV